VISAAELASLRTRVTQTFTATASILRRTEVEDTQGGTTITYPAVATYACAFSRYQTRPLERESQPRVMVIADWVFVFPIAADIRQTDRIRVGTRTFEVVDAGIGSADLARKAMCLEIT
jgi:hypothetical protein